MSFDGVERIVSQETRKKLSIARWHSLEVNKNRDKRKDEFAVVNGYKVVHLLGSSILESGFDVCKVI